MNTKYSTLGFDKVYVINLKRRQDRKKTLKSIFPTVDFTFIEAIDGKDLDQKQLLKDKILNTSFFDPNGMITMGVFACALSHKKAWDQAIKDGITNALFLEDDITTIMSIFDSNGKFTPPYQDILQEIQNTNYDLIHLGKKSPITPGINVDKYLTIPVPDTNYNGAHSYIVSNSMLKHLSNKILPLKHAVDVYLEQFYNTHNTFTLKDSIFHQISDISESSIPDSDTFFNEFRKGGGRVGISFDENGNILNKNIAKYIKHPKDENHYTEVVLSEPKFGIQKFNSHNKINNNFFGISKLLIYLSENINKRGNMVEINCHLGENTFYFGSSGLFHTIYAIDPLKGEDKFNLEHNLIWEDIKMGFDNNNYFHKNINHIKDTPENLINIFNDLSFVYINNRKDIDIQPLINLYLSKLNQKGFIGGSNIQDAPKGSINFIDGSWLIKKENIYL
tara:strand:+ start:2814 stop:4157 length:1344 start_codon:yes stop_codon:yes gene_type:complete